MVVDERQVYKAMSSGPPAPCAGHLLLEVGPRLQRVQGRTAVHLQPSSSLDLFPTDILSLGVTSRPGRTYEDG